MKSSVQAVIVAGFCVLVAPVAMAQGGSVVVTVKGVPSGDILNVRQWPKASAPIVGILKNGDQGFVNTKDCWNSNTGKKIPQSKVRFGKPGTWCSVMAGDDGDIVGYVRTKYIQ